MVLEHMKLDIKLPSSEQIRLLNVCLLLSFSRGLEMSMVECED